MNKRTVLLAILLGALLLAPCCRRQTGGARRGGLNRVLTNELSDTATLYKMDRDIERFMQRWYIKGLSLSVMRNDSLVYAKGYGWADEEQGERMGPGSIMRVASVSKLITAAGIMKLCEEGRLSLGDKVFGPHGILRDSCYTAAIRDKNYYEITVEQLLRHEAGFTVRGADPLFNTPAIMEYYGLRKAPDARTLVTLMLPRRLRYKPGASHEYSNFGYLLLSLIIEKVTGQDYEHWMQQNVLEPAGCTDAHLARNYYHERYKGEVRYYMQDNDPPVPEYNNSRDSVVRCYGGNDIRGLSGAGAWVISTPELALLVASIDGRSEIPDILSRRSVREMTASSHEHKFSLGWNTTDPKEGWVRTGSLSGTNALIYYFPDGDCWILANNTHSWRGPRFAKYLRGLVKQCRDRYSESLPARNLFLIQ